MDGHLIVRVWVAGLSVALIVREPREVYSAELEYAAPAARIGIEDR